MLPERLCLLEVDLGTQPCGRLTKASQYTFQYGRDDPAQPALALLMPPQRLQYASNSLFAAMDMNLPEGYLFQQLRNMFPKQPLTDMHLLALMGSNGIGRMGYRSPEQPRPTPPATVSKGDLLRAGAAGAAGGQALFQTLVQAYLSTGAGVSGIQPKILVPDRATLPVPTLIVKAAATSYPGLSANEFVCLRAAQLAGIEVATFDLSQDGELLVLDRFDVDAQGNRLGFEDMASLLGLCVRDRLSDRKYRGSYEDIADLLKTLGLGKADLRRFFAQVAFTAMVRNGDGHLKNYGLLYSSPHDVRLAPMFDVVTTAIYRYQRFDGGADLVDNTLALKLFRGRHGSRTYPTTAELLDFGRRVCQMERPQEVVQAIAQGMHESLRLAQGDARIAPGLLANMTEAWETGFEYASEIARRGGKL